MEHFICRIKALTHWFSVFRIFSSIDRYASIDWSFTEQCWSPEYAQSRS